MAAELDCSGSAVEDVVIVGAGIAGLATALGLHRVGIRSLVLESAGGLRSTGFALGIWTNAWRALDALGIGQILRHKHLQLTGFVTTSSNSGIITSDASFAAIDPRGDLEIRCVNRKLLLDTLENELPRGTIRYHSKLVHIQVQPQDGFKSIHLADGTTLKTKVLIGCDGVNSVVAKCLGFSDPSLAGRIAVRGFTDFEDGHGLGTKLLQFSGSGVRYGVVPCDLNQVYWAFTFSPSPQEQHIDKDPAKLKQFILSKLGQVPNRIRQVFEETHLTNMVSSALRLRYPWELVWGNISKDNMCVVGDALHPMTPDVAQGACSALEDSVILARILGEALKKRNNNAEEQESASIEKALAEYARERRWRSVELVVTSYMVGMMQQSNWRMVRFVRDKIMAKLLGAVMLKNSTFDCGKLT